MQKRNLRALRASAAVALAAFATPVVAQVDGTWITPGGGTYSNPANWLGGVPDAGGVATFGNPSALATNVGVTFDISPTLSAIDFNTGYAYLLSGNGPINLVGPAQLNVLRSTADSPQTITSGHTISVAVSGSAGLTKTGAGTVTLLQSNSFTGNVAINGGVLGTTVGDGAFGSGGSISINNAALRASTTAMTSTRTINIAGNAEIQGFANVTLDGVISGTGNLIRSQGSDSTVLTLRANNTYTGSTTVRGGFLLLDGLNGAIQNSPVIDVAGIFGVENVNGLNNNRLNANVNVISRGARLAFGANSGGAAVHTVPTLTLASGRTELLMTSATGQTNTVALGSIVRDNRATLFLRGVSVDGSAARVTLDQSVALIGGGGAAGTTNQSIVPWMIANPATNQFSIGNTFVTRDAATGLLRPLDINTEYATDLTTAAATDNVRLTPALGGAANPIAVPAEGRTVNSLIFANTAGAGQSLTVSGGPLTITSGAITTTPTNSLNSTTITVPVSFGSAEGVTHNQSGNTLTFNAPVSGSGGLTIGGTGLVSMGTNAISTYSGVTTIIGGTVQFNGDVLVNQPGPFGSSDTAIVIASGSVGSGSGGSGRLFTNGIFRIDRDLEIAGDSLLPGVLGTTNAAGRELTVNGDVKVDGALGFEHGAASGIIRINGDISGEGRLTGVGTSSGTTYLNGNNTFTGGVNVTNSIMYAGSDTAFGTGTVYISGASSALSSNARIGAFGGTRTLANNLVLRNNLTVVGDEALIITGSVDLGGGNPGTGGTSYQISTLGASLLELTGVVSAGGINKTNPGTLVLSGNNDFSGGVTVSGGTLLVNNAAGSGTGSGNVSVLSGATLGGSGSIAGSVTLAGGAILSPGTSPGTLAIGANLALNDTSSLQFDIGADVSDLVTVGGNLTLDGVLNVDELAGFGNGIYPLFTYGGTLTDNGLTVSSLSGIFVGSIDTATSGVVNLVVVPEPASLGLIVLAGGLLKRRRR